MKYIKKFNEAVIHPQKLENDFTINTIEDLKEYGKQNDFDVVDYDEFWASLNEFDKETAPPKFGIPFFALFHPERGKAMFVICDENVPKMMHGFKEIVDDIIGHEKVHAEQTKRRKGLVFDLPSPTDQKAYFSNKEEIMAFSWTISNELSKGNTKEEALEMLNSKMPIGSQASQIWHTIKRVCDEKTIKRYKKYIYMYINQMSDDEENLHTIINKKQRK